MKALIHLILVLIIVSISNSQDFDIKKYNDFLTKNKDMSPAQLNEMYPSTKFYSTNSTNLNNVEFYDKVDKAYKLTNDEKQILSNNSFVVSERLKQLNFLQSFLEIYHKDLPVYVSSDAILHAVHFSFDNVLKQIEGYILISSMNTILNNSREYLRLIDTNSTNFTYNQAIKDVDLYLTIAQSLNTTQNVNPIFNANINKRNEILELVKNEKPAKIQLFSEAYRVIDFSQFTVRGHYTLNSNLSAYFQMMMWLGRTEFYFENPQNTPDQLSVNDIKRHIYFTYVLNHCIEKSKSLQLLNIVDKILTTMIAPSDNIISQNVIDVAHNIGLTLPSDLLDSNNFNKYKDGVLNLKISSQAYCSQIIRTNVNSKEQIVLPKVYLLMGQRPVFDGFVLANVSFDRILYNNHKERRMMPKTQDILFALGNNSSFQLLESDLKKYNYSSNLASLRYLADTYDSTFWQSGTYNTWLNSIRKLNIPNNRSNLPKYMQTAAWAQKSMTTQLASWSQLRHDFLLNTKQSYSSSYLCSFPYGYIEPVPEFYHSISNIYEKISSLIFDSLKNNKNINITNLNNISILNNNYKRICSQLESISKKELLNMKLTIIELDFIKQILYLDPQKSCTQKAGVDGWYNELLGGLSEEVFRCENQNLGELGFDESVIADVHTTPMDENENEVGWVLHCGTGRPNSAIIIAKDSSGQERAYAGPVFSYYENITNDYKRLTDQEWRNINAEGTKPLFTNLFQTDKNGKINNNQDNLWMNNNDVNFGLPIFDALVKVGEAPLKVQFINKTQANYNSYKWFFGDGDSSNLKSPLHIFNSYGKYNVKLVCSDANLSKDVTYKDFILVSQKPNAYFSISNNIGMAPLSVDFINKSTGEITNTNWNFGDGESSIIQNPSHIYTKEGNFTVSLKVSNGNNSSSYTKEKFISVAKTDVKDVLETNYILYPNPANNYIELPFGLDLETEFNVSSSAGNLVYQAKVENNKLNISNLQKGVYFIKLNNKIYKFIKE